MYVIHKPWEWTTVVNKDGGYSLVKADEETRKKQLEEFKKKRIEELKREMNELEEIF